MNRYIYFVGKPYPHKEALDITREYGYKIGLLLDKSLPAREREGFDNVVEVDFSSPEAMFASLEGKDLTIDGLVCTYENYIVAKSQLAEHFKLAAPSVDSAKMSTDKYLMRRALKHAAPAVTPDFGLVSSGAEAIETAGRIGYPLILKPTNLVKSLLVFRCNNEAELLHNFAYAQERITELYKKHRVHGRQPQLLIEEYIDGQSCSIAAFVDKEGQPHFCEGIVSLVNAQAIGVDDNYIYERRLPGQFDKDLEAELFQAAGSGIAALKMTSTPAHVELIYNKQGVKLIEIGARIGGYRPRMYAMSYGLDLIAQEIKLALGELPDLSGSFKAYSAVYELFPEDKGEFVSIEGTADTSKFNYYSVKAKPGQTIGPAKNGYKAATIIIVSRPGEAEFLKLCQSAEQLKVKVK